MFNVAKSQLSIFKCKAHKSRLLSRSGQWGVSLSEAVGIIFIDDVWVC